MPPSEIDDIFAASKKAMPHTPAAPSQDPQKKGKKKKKSAKKHKQDSEGKFPPPSSLPAEQLAKRKVPETILDPSIQPTAPSTTRSNPRIAERPPATKKRKLDSEEEERFKDSRGTGPRRKTEEGFLVYKESELGITDQGGDTPLCPFDCQCCF